MKHDKIILSIILILGLFTPIMGDLNKFVVYNDQKSNSQKDSSENLIDNDKSLSISDLYDDPIRTAPDYAQRFKDSKEKIDSNRNGLSHDLELWLQGKEPQSEKAVLCTFDGPISNTFYQSLQKNGLIPNKIWQDAIYGFTITVSNDQFLTLLDTLSTCNLQDHYYLEFDNHVQAQMYVAAQQMNVRDYVWDSLGYTGDKNTSIAVIDTGLDDSHSNHGSYGDKDFSKKIVGWYDATDTGYLTPVDDGSHGSHCSGIAAGSGFEPVDGNSQLHHSTPYSFNYTGYSLPSDIYYFSACYFNVTAPGTINVQADFIDHTISPSHAYAGFVITKNSIIMATYDIEYASSWNNRNLAYAVTAGNLGVYEIQMKINLTRTGGGNCLNPDYSMIFNWSIPYLDNTDSYPYYTGIAPDSRLVGIKVLGESGGLTSWVIDGINWAVSNRVAYNITILSLSLGGSQFSMAEHLAVERAVDAGLVVVVAAGNDGSGSNTIGQPGNSDSIISVAALTYQDNVTSYSSQGGLSYTGHTQKPDLAAPGGAFSFPMYSTDSNDQDEFFTDQYLNDARNMQGTSMATPAVSGAANLLIDAMGGSKKWVYTRSQAISVKNLLLMTASETGRLREDDMTGTYSPIFNRGAKDPHEGYGRINVDAAITAVTQTASLGLSYQDTLYSSTATPFMRHVWARNISLTYGQTYDFTLDVPATADFDLYLYDSTADTYGDPVIVESSCESGNMDEEIRFDTKATGYYYLVVKAVSGSGQFSLSLTDKTVNSMIKTTVSPSEGTTATRIINAYILDQSTISVWVHVEYYNGYFNGKLSGCIIDYIPLYDDGAHSDGALNDRIYGNTFDTSTYRNGNYSIDIVILDPNFGTNITHYLTGAGFYKGTDLVAPDVISMFATPDSIIKGENVYFGGTIYDYSQLSNAVVGIYTAAGTYLGYIPLYDNGLNGDYFANDGYLVGGMMTKSLSFGTYYYRVNATDNSAAKNLVQTGLMGYFNITERPSQIAGLNYQMTVNTTYSWISTGTQIITEPADDQGYTLTLDWAFPFYDQNYTTVNISANGYMTFESISALNYSNVKFPSQQTAEPDARKIIAPFWTDLRYNTASAGVWYDKYTDYLVIEWYSARFYDGSSWYDVGSFEVFLYRNGTIKFQYNNLNANAYYLGATCGINLGGTTGLETSFYQLDQCIGTTKAITFNLPARDDCKPTYTIYFPRINERLYGTTLTLLGIGSNEPLYDFQYRIWNYSAGAYVTTWQSTITTHELSVGKFRIETRANDSVDNMNSLSYDFYMLGDLQTQITTAYSTPEKSLWIEWISAPDAVLYYLYRDTSIITPSSLDGLSIYQTLGGKNNVTYNDTAISFGAVYYYGVIAVSSQGIGWLWKSLRVDYLPYASFSVNASIINRIQYVQFTNSSKGSGDSIFDYQWSFGDGTGNVSVPNPLHQFNSFGLFTVTLTITDADSDMSVFTMNIDVNSEYPVASFIVNASTILPNQWVQFTDTSPELGKTPTTYQWNFGDGSSNSTEQNPIHQYTQLGQFNVVLTLNDSNGALCVTHTTITVQQNVVTDLFPTANFTVNITIIVVGNSVQFTDHSTGGNQPLSYQWQFETGIANLTEKNPVYRFTKLGKYKVTLTVIDQDGDISVCTLLIEVVNPSTSNGPSTTDDDNTKPLGLTEFIIIGVVGIVGVIVVVVLKGRKKIDKPVKKSTSNGWD